MALSVAVGLSIFAAGCAGSIPATSVYGTYRADYPFGHQTLTLRPDGTYEQQVVIQQPVPLAHSISKIHDDMLDRYLDLGEEKTGLPRPVLDLFYNPATMLPAALTALKKETTTSVRGLAEDVKDALNKLQSGNWGGPQGVVTCQQ